MANPDKNKDNFIARQADLFRFAKRDCDMTTKRLSLLTEIPEPTLISWKSGTAMPAWAMFELSKHIPDDLMTMLAEPSGKFIGTAETSNNDLHELGRETASFTAELMDALGDGKVTPTERANLQEKARKVAAKARAVAT